MERQYSCKCALVSNRWNRGTEQTSSGRLCQCWKRERQNTKCNGLKFKPRQQTFLTTTDQPILILNDWHCAYRLLQTVCRMNIMKNISSALVVRGDDVWRVFVFLLTLLTTRSTIHGASTIIVQTFMYIAISQRNILRTCLNFTLAESRFAYRATRKSGKRAFQSIYVIADKEDMSLHSCPITWQTRKTNRCT